MCDSGFDEEPQSPSCYTVSGLRTARTNPAYLVSNSTSHLWVFSAIAEIVDNSYDPDCNADKLDINHEKRQDIDVLSFTDDGAGMDLEQLYNMLSFGYCSKVGTRGHKPIGHYGNGFKSGSMRIGKDAIVFTKRRADDGVLVKSVGLLSQTFLAKVNADTVLLPICSWTGEVLSPVEATGVKSLALICGHCPLFDGDPCGLEEEFDLITETGTRILIYNLRRCSEEPDANLELDFSDRTDIVNSESLVPESFTPEERVELLPPVPLIRRSLKAYLSILFMKPRLLIRINGFEVRSQHVQRSLGRHMVQYYTPKMSDAEEARMNLRNSYRVRIVIGFLPRCQADYGALLYHRNRLILPYEKLVKEPERAKGVALIAEVDHLQPDHIKQDFERNQNFRNCIVKLTHRLKHYLDDHGRLNHAHGDAENGDARWSDHWNWVKCDICGKWRRLPLSEDTNGMENRDWNCGMNTDSYFNHCSLPEEDDHSEISQQRVEARAAAAASRVRVRPRPRSGGSASATTTAPAAAGTTAAQDATPQAKRRRVSRQNDRNSTAVPGESADASVQTEPMLTEPKTEPKATSDTAVEQLRRLRSHVLELLSQLLPEEEDGGGVQLPSEPSELVDRMVESVVKDKVFVA